MEAAPRPRLWGGLLRCSMALSPFTAVRRCQRHHVLLLASAAGRKSGSAYCCQSHHIQVPRPPLQRPLRSTSDAQGFLLPKRRSSKRSGSATAQLQSQGETPIMSQRVKLGSGGRPSKAITKKQQNRGCFRMRNPRRAKS